MNIKVNIFNSETNDLAIVIDLLRASTTITVALNTFEKVIPVNNTKKALQIKEKEKAILAGEENLHQIEGFDLSNSPTGIQKYQANTLVLKTTNGTKVLENIKNRNKNITVLVGTAINAEAVAKKALEKATDEIELIIAGLHEKFTIEDAIGAGLIVEEIIKIAKEQNIPITLEETALATKILAENHTQAQKLIQTSQSAKRLTKKRFTKDIQLCKQINKTNTVPIYENGQITKL